MPESRIHPSMNTGQESVHIRCIEEAERPCERLLRLGARQLSDVELLAVLIHSGNAQGNALQLAYRTLAGTPEGGAGLDFLSRAEAAELQQIKGLGKTKSAQILAAIELGQRSLSRTQAATDMSSPEAVWRYMQKIWTLEEENLYALLLDVRCCLIREVFVARGSLNQIAFSPRDVLKSVLRANAHSFILVHNHPSGNTEPSVADIRATCQLGSLARYMGVQLLDHVVLSPYGFHSMRARGQLQYQDLRSEKVNLVQNE